MVTKSGNKSAKSTKARSRSRSRTKKRGTSETSAQPARAPSEEEKKAKGEKTGLHRDPSPTPANPPPKKMLEVLALIGRREVGGNTLYLVKWTAWGQNPDTWLKEGDLPEYSELMEELNTKKRQEEEQERDRRLSTEASREASREGSRETARSRTPKMRRRGAHAGRPVPHPVPVSPAHPRWLPLALSLPCSLQQVNKTKRSKKTKK